MPGDGGPTNEADADARVDNRAASYRDVGQVVNKPEIHQTFSQTNRVAYEVDPKDSWLDALVSKGIDHYLGDQLGSRISWVFIGFGGIGLVPHLTGFPWIFSVIAYPLFWVGLALLAVGYVIRRGLRYKADRTCPDCKQNHSLQEKRSNRVEDLSVHEGVRRKTTRFLRCDDCGYEEERTYTRLIED